MYKSTFLWKEYWGRGCLELILRDWALLEMLPVVLWNQKVHHHAHKSPPLVCVLSQTNPNHTTPSYLIQDPS
jgi:hypothetical protein